MTDVLMVGPSGQKFTTQDKERLTEGILFTIRRYGPGKSTRELSDVFVKDTGGGHLRKYFETKEQAARWFKNLLKEMRLSGLLAQSYEDKKWYLFDPRYDSVEKRWNG